MDSRLRGNDRNYMGKIIQFFKEVRVEMGKVVWPTRKEALKITGIVILLSLFVAVFLGLIDFGLGKLIAITVGKQ